MKAEPKGPVVREVVAAFPGRRLRHFQKQCPVKEELKRSGRRVQVELKLRAREPQSEAVSGVRTGNAVTGVPGSRVRISPAPPPHPVVTEPTTPTSSGSCRRNCWSRRDNERWGRGISWEWG